MKSNPSAVLNAMSRINVQAAQAGSETDQTAILRAVQSSPGGVEGINQLATAEVRQWLLHTARRLMSESDLLIENAGKTALPTETSVAEGHMLALCLGHYLGAWSDALLLFQKVASGYERVTGTNSQHTLAAKTQVAVATEACGDMLGAKSVYEDVLQRQLQTIGALNSDTLVTQKNLAAILYQLGDASCATMFQSVVEGQMALHGVDAEQTLVAQADYARVKCCVLGDIEGGRRDYEHVLLKLASTGAIRKPHAQLVQAQFAEILYGLGEQIEATAKLREVVDVLRTVQGPNHSYTQQWLSTLHQWEARA
eukprot:COSAG02_NODE_5629_length_4171_cov_2.909180_2_plen_311_part_00